MSNRTRLIILGFILLFAFGFIFLRGPKPHISIKPETITTFGSIDITNTMITSWIVTFLIVLFIFLATRNWSLVPGKAQNFLEWLLVEGEFILSTVRVPFVNFNTTESLAGERNARRFFPVIAVIFFFVLIGNWLSLLPIFNTIGKVEQGHHGFVLEEMSVGPLDLAYVPLSGPGGLSGDTIDEEDADAEQTYEEAVDDGKVVGELFPFFRGPATDVNTTLALAIVSAIAVETWGITSMGFFTYGRRFFNFGGMFRGLIHFSPGEFFAGFIDFFVGFLEFISEIVRLLSFTARLFGNLFAGEVVILMFTFMTPLLVTLPFYGLEFFIGFIQAYIFAILTLMFAVMATSHTEAHGAPAKEHKGEHETHPVAAGVQEAV